MTQPTVPTLPTPPPRPLSLLLPWLAAACLVAGLAAPAAAQVRSIEAVGTAPLPEQRTAAFDARGSALDAAIGEAVLRVAEELLIDTPEPIEREALAAALGDEPRIYAARFRLLEDRGEREALFAGEQGSGREYVVVAAVDVDIDRVRQRLVGLALLEESAAEPIQRLRLEVVGLDSHGAYAAFTKALAAPLGQDRVAPLEIERGWALFELETSLDVERLLGRLQRSAPAGLDVVRLAPTGGVERLAVRWDEAGG